MTNVNIDFNRYLGRIKPMNAVNNGPVDNGDDEQSMSNFRSYKEARIPYARVHDSSFYSGYGGEHAVDISAIFPDFRSNPYDDSSYDFDLTDDYLRQIESAGTHVFFQIRFKDRTREKEVRHQGSRRFRQICSGLRAYNPPL